MNRRLLPAVVVAAVAVVAVVALASGGEGADGSSASAPAREAREDPPLRRGRPQVVEPVAGETAEVAALPETAAEPKADPGTSDAARSRASRVQADSLRDDGPTDDDSISKANVLPNGIALPPLEAPEAVQRIIDAGNVIARSPYKWGGGHGKWLDRGYDCSGSISYALASAGLLNAPLDSGRLMRWGRPGPGKWVSIHTNPGHVYMVVAGVRFDTSGQRVSGSRWQETIRRPGNFVTRHPPGL